MDYSQDYNEIRQGVEHLKGWLLGKFYDDSLCDLCRKTYVEKNEIICSDCAWIIGE
jgi:hypothetical protein